MKIMFKNKDKLLDMPINNSRKKMLAILEAAISAVDPYQSVVRNVKLEKGVLIIAGQRYKLKDYDNIYVVGMGKAAIPMTKAIIDVLGEKVHGVVNALEGGQMSGVKLNKAGHPIPTEEGCKGSEQILKLAKRATEKDIVLCLISGGGSAMMPLPEDGITLKDKMAVTKLLLECGANIREINAVRKHISKIKGGKLAVEAYPATLVSLIVSDVIGDPLDSIASGPTSPDSTTFADVRAIIKKYELWKKLPASVSKHIKEGKNETPKEGDKAFEKVRNIIIGSNKVAVNAAYSKAEELGYNTLALTTFMEGEAREIGIGLTSVAREVIKYDEPVARPASIILGGETTVTLTGKGHGGRNQELCLSALRKLPPKTTIASIGTDGIDGNSDAAGAIIDQEILEASRDKNLDIEYYLKNNDSNTFFKEAGGLLITGPTGTNVADIMVMLIEK
jgi:glycerate-2-kinase